MGDADPDAGKIARALGQVAGALDRARIGYAFGGAIALAYYGAPRGTTDIDVGIFLPAGDADRLLDALGLIADIPATFAATVAADGFDTIRVSGIGVDCFFSSSDFHEDMAQTVRRVPFNGGEIPIVATEHYVVMKALFDRGKDWSDVEAVLACCTEFDPNVVRTWLVRAGAQEARARFEQLWKERPPAL